MSAYSDILYAFDDSLSYILGRVPSAIQNQVQEIRLRVGQSLALTVNNKTVFVKQNGSVSYLADGDCRIINDKDILQTVSRLCERSLYSCECQLRKGYISLRNGCRAGIGGCYSDSQSGNMRCYTSVNIRIANQVTGCSQPILEGLGHGLHNILLVGPPGSGKTTMLRDVVRCYSNDGYRVSVADERGEIAAMHQRGSGFDLGSNVDVMSDADKSFAVHALLKYFNPQIIVFDELSDDALSLQACMSSGVHFITTLHSDSIQNTFNRLKMLNISKDMFDVFVLLSSESAGLVKEIYHIGEMHEVDRNNADIIGACDTRLASLQSDAQAS